EYRVALRLTGFPVAEGNGEPPPGGPPQPPPGGPQPPQPPQPPQGGPPHPPGPPGGPMPHGGHAPHMPPLAAVTAEMKAKYDRIDKKYADPATSGLTCKVTKGTVTLDPWSLDGTAAPESKQP